MALNFDLKEIDREKYPDTPEGHLNPVTNYLIWATVHVDMGQPIKDPTEWVVRNVMMNRLFYHLPQEDMRWADEDELIKMLWDHRGLHTNVINTTRPAFFKKLRERLEDDMSEIADKVEVYMEGGA